MIHSTKVLSILLLAVATMGQAKAPDLVAQAREAYNEQRYGDAIKLASEARRVPASAQPAAVVLSRAYLERYRQTSVAADLDAARQTLMSADSSALGERDRIELLIAFGQSLYFDESYSLDDRFSAAAEQFEVALAHADVLDRASRDRLFEWWAGSIDRQAQQGAESTRQPLYTRIVRRAEHELAQDDGAVSASYWLAAAARGANELTRAVGAAAAGWIRAAALGARGETLRTDLDRLMRQVILPERARELTVEGDARSTLTQLETQWEELKGKWAK